MNPVFLQIQAVEIRRLLDEAADDPILVPQLAERLSEVEDQLRRMQVQPGSILPAESVTLPRAAIFLRGGGVHGAEGILPSLAGEALIRYEQMFIEQALHDERDAARQTGRQRRPRGSGRPGLLFVGTPRGSFGLEFTPQSEPSLVEVHRQSLLNVGDALVKVTSGKPLEESLPTVPSRVLQPLKLFLKALAQHGAELRLAFQSEQPRAILADQIQTTVDRLERDTSQEQIDVVGTFRGVTRESGYFDLVVGEDIITGTVADDLTEEDLERIDQLTNKTCLATLYRTVIRRITGHSTESHVLLDAVETEKEPAILQ